MNAGFLGVLVMFERVMSIRAMIKAISIPITRPTLAPFEGH